MAARCSRLPGSFASIPSHMTEHRGGVAVSDVVEQLDDALAATGAVVAGIREGQWGDPTPCVEWDVRTEVSHLVGGLRIFTAAIEQRDAGGDHDTHDWLGDSPADSYAEAAAADIAAWRRPDALDRTFALSFGDIPGQMAVVIHLTEVIVHGIDLAVATGQVDRVDQELPSTCSA